MSAARDQRITAARSGGRANCCGASPRTRAEGQKQNLGGHSPKFREALLLPTLACRAIRNAPRCASRTSPSLLIRRLSLMERPSEEHSIPTALRIPRACGSLGGFGGPFLSEILPKRGPGRKDQTVSEGRSPLVRMDCEERDRLIDGVTKAAQGVYAALAADRMRLDFVHDIQAARRAEREAATALAEHRRGHNC
jgi:hypothetical protein